MINHEKKSPILTEKASEFHVILLKQADRHTKLTVLTEGLSQAVVSYMKRILVLAHIQFVPISS